MKKLDAHAPICRVRLLEDRAFVTRRYQGDVEVGTFRLNFAGLTPVLSDKSLLARCADENVSVTDCRLVRRQRAESEKARIETQGLEKKIQQQKQITEECRARLMSAESSALSCAWLLKAWIEQTAEDVVWGQSESAEWSAQLELLRKTQTELIRSQVERERTCHTEDERLRKLTRQMDNLSTPSDEVEAELQVDIETTKSGSIEMEIEYCVPGACWRPYHSAEWHEDRLRFVSQACVWQNSGEDWNDVQLTFSTQRATLGTEPPPLGRDVLRLQKKRKAVVVETVEESVKVHHKTVFQVPGIEDGGEVLTMAAPISTSVPSDGRPHRVELFCFESDLRSELLVVGELAHCVFLNSQHENEGSKPVLAGPVDLIKSCGLVGRSSVKHTAPGQTFELSWGPQSELRVHREHRLGKEDSSMVSSWKKTVNKVDIHLSNLGPDSHDLLIRERIPVSELKHVRIHQDLNGTTDKAVADENGFVEWKVTLPGKERRSLKLAYEVQKKKSVEGDV
jgi:uncharacterized protein (TIGR02231 family)